MTTNEIKGFLARQGLSVSAAARLINEDRSCVSRVVNYQRPSPRIRKKLKRKFPGLWFRKWGNKPEQLRAA